MSLPSWTFLSCPIPPLYIVTQHYLWVPCVTQQIPTGYLSNILCGSQQTGKFWKTWEYQTTWPASWDICVQVRKQQLELDMEQQTGSQKGEEYVKAVYCHSAYLTYMQSTSWEMLGWMKHKLESRLPEEI